MKDAYTGAEVDTILFRLEIDIMKNKATTRKKIMEHVFHTITDARIKLKDRKLTPQPHTNTIK